MIRGLASIGGVLVLASAPLLADFSYQEKSTITGGMLVSVMKVAGVFSKQAREAREPQQSTVAVKGDRLVHRYPAHMQVIDLGAQTITSVDLQKKTYTTMTFEQFKQMLAQMQDAMQKSKEKENTDIHFKVSAKNTGATKTIGGVEAKESIITMEMEGTDQQTGQTGAMVVTTDVWVAPAANGYHEIRDFYRRMAEKLDWAPGSTSFAGHPEVAKGMAESMKEVGKLDGMPVLEVTSMGTKGDPSNQSNSSAQHQQSQQQSAQPSLGGALGSALGGHFGLGRKKKDQQQQQQPADSQSSGAAPATGANGAPNGLLEMTIEMSGFSSAPVDDSTFAIPAGFKQVEPDMRRGVQ